MTGSSIRETKAALARFGLRARKTLGQHFLVDSGALTRVVRAADLSPEDTVIEVGPGLGALTRRLSQHAGRVIAVESDSRLAAILPEILAGLDNVAIVDTDVLKTDPPSLLRIGRPDTIPAQYKVVANIPYYITSPILRHFLEATLKPSLIVLMVQKEVGQAIVARPGNLGILAISVQFYGRPSIVGKVPAASFYPPPKVDSVILRIDVYDQPPLGASGSDHFFELVRAGFSAPRKQLRNSLAQGLAISPREAEDLLNRAGVDPRRRAETLSLPEWARLCEQSE
jgi:16S rRNA (adenine1518-N6/adenine1519-N6)-dimethyltransferase